MVRYLVLGINLAIALSHYCFAGTVEWNGQQIQYADSLSLQNFSGQIAIDVTILPGTTVYASTFDNETPDTQVFSSTMTGVTFIEVHLDNVVIPPGNIVKNVYTEAPKRFKVQTDRSDWIIDRDNKPIEPLNKEQYLRLGISIDPRDLPATDLDQSIITKRLEEAQSGGGR